MSVTLNNVSTYYAAACKTEITGKITSKTEGTADKNTAATVNTAANTDTYEKSADAANSAADAGGYQIDVDALIEQNNKRIADFTSRIMSMVTRQGEKSNMSLFGLNLTVTDQDIEAAKESIAEGGEWSVNSVADRIMNMAYALSGGDESKLETLKNAVIRGFSQAGFDPDNRSTMPAITGDTYDEIMTRFDDWEENGMKTYSNTDLENAVKAVETRSVDVEA